MSHFPETLGHCVVYQPPGVFSGLWAFAQGVMDAKMRSKVVFVRGDVSDNSSNDLLMRQLCRDDWKALTGCEQLERCKGCTEGFEPSAYWQGVVERERAWGAAHAQNGIAGVHRP